MASAWTPRAPSGAPSCTRAGASARAAINAVHSDAATAADTDWRQIVQLYDRLLALAPSPTVALNRAVAVAVAEVEGAAAALEPVDRLEVGVHRLFHAIRADLLRRLGRSAEATSAYEAAISRTNNAVERDLLQRRHDGLTPASVRSRATDR